jgi:hypothetical protein
VSAKTLEKEEAKEVLVFNECQSWCIVEIEANLYDGFVDPASKLVLIVGTKSLIHNAHCYHFLLFRVI